MHIGTNMIFGGILEGVWPINNQKKFLLPNFRCQRTSATTTQNPSEPTKNLIQHKPADFRQILLFTCDPSSYMSA